jgi:hypothetical protein
MVITSTATEAMSKIFLDIVGSIRTDEFGYSYALTLQCELSKYVLAIPLKSKDATTVAKAFVENFILKHGIPEAIAHDCGTEFLADVMKQVCKTLELKQLPSTAYHHQSIGALENSHKHLAAFLRMQVEKYPGTWSSWLPFWCFSYNTSTHASTNFSPFELVFGRECRLPSNLREEVSPCYNSDNYALELKFRLQQAAKEARENLIRSKEVNKRRYDAHLNTHEYKVGDKVLVKNETGRKLDSLFTGPYEVTFVEGPNIKIKIKDKEKLIHKNRVKPFIC